MRKILGIILAGWLFVLCGSGCVVNGVFPALNALTVEEGMVRGVNDFGVTLLRNLWENKPANLFISPASLELCLAMVASGARGQTQAEMLQVLGLSGMSMEEIQENNRNLLKMLNLSNTRVELRVANSLWARKGFPFYERFLSDIRKYYRAEAEVVDFTDPETLSRINRWVDRATNSRIDRILDRISQDAILILLNAIYFRGKWLYRFDPKNTEPLPFYTLSGESQDLPTMWQEGKFDYTEDDTLQMVRLPYADNRFSMYILLPRTTSGMETLLPSLNATRLESLVEQLEEREGEIYLPRFRITFGETLNEPLQTLGMRQAFDELNADFGGMLPIPPVAFVSEVKHKSVLEVNEEGTEAAAVTSVTITLTAALPEERFTMRVDHPFLLIIRDERSGLFLFIGVVVDPEST